MQKTLSFLTEVIIFFALPIALMTYSSTAMAARPLIMGLGGAYVTWQLHHLQSSLDELGLRPTHFWVSLKRLIIPSLLMVFFTFLVFISFPRDFLLQIIGYDALTGLPLGSRLMYYILLSVPVQEFMFRSYITLRLKGTFRSRALIILVSTLLFTLAHLPFYSYLMFAVTAYMGWVYIINYLRYRNLFSLILSHAFVGSLILLIRNTYFPY